jgi:hypothetical protein
MRNALKDLFRKEVIILFLIRLYTSPNYRSIIRLLTCIAIFYTILITKQTDDTKSR